MISTLINPAAVARAGYFGRSDEYLFYVMIGRAGVRPLPLADDWFTSEGRTHTGQIRWDLLRRSGSSPTREGHSETFYPFFISSDGSRFHSVGEPIGVGADRKDVISPPGTVAVWPIRQNGSEGRWRLKPETVRRVLEEGALRIGEFKGEQTPIYCVAEGERAKVTSGIYQVLGHRSDGSIITSTLEGIERLTIPGSQWRIRSHDATQHGTRLLLNFLPDRRFPFPKSLYAVEDALRFFVADKPESVILDFFAGSGTTAHAVMRLNRQDGGRRRSILVTNNEVSADEADLLQSKGHRPGDPEWEALGICEYITKPRIEAAITGRTPAGDPIKGEYRFTDEFPMAEGFEENVEFFDLTYEDPERVRQDLAFSAVAPLLWMRAGGVGRRINEPSDTFDIAETYAVLFNVDAAGAFVDAVTKSGCIRLAYIITDDEKQYQLIANELPQQVHPVRLYESYLRTVHLGFGED
jgi:adenine-specific DNA-methyltransferase